jgi:hypothetical protein
MDNDESIELDENGMVITDGGIKTITIDSVKVESKPKPEVVQEPFKEVEVNSAKPTRIPCLAKFKNEKGEDMPCTRKAVKGTTFCKKCTQAQREAEVKKEEEVKKVEGREVAVKAMFGMHYALYMNFEMLGSMFGHDLSGLPDDLAKDHEQFKAMYGSVYDQYGPKIIDEYVGPAYALAFMSMGQVGRRYMQNQKKLPQ